MAATIYRHWAATPHNLVRSELYHPIISGSGVVCRVLEFAEEFGISPNFQPFTLGERRGG
jgi:hypothetical protein